MNISNETINLPTITEIGAAAEVPSMPDSSAKVVRAKEQFSVNLAIVFHSRKAENMKFPAADSEVPVPKVYAAFHRPEINRTSIIMEYVSSGNLQKLLPYLMPIADTLRGQK